MSKYGDNLSADDIYVKRLHWDSFVPPLSAGDPNDQTLASVLLTGNDANQKDITNLNDLSCDSATIPALTSTTGDITTVNANTVNLEVGLDGLRANDTKSTITNCDLTSATNTFPSTFIPNLSSVLTNGNDAGDKDITGVKDLTIISTGKISALNPSSSGLDTKIMKTDDLEPYTAGGAQSSIGKTTAFHAITGETLNANAKLEARTAENGCHFAASSFYSTEPTPTLKATLTNGILKTNSIVVDNDITSASPAIAMSEYPGAAGTGAIACNGLIQAGQVLRGPLVDLVNNADGTLPKYKISTGGSFEGADPAKCVFTNCDFTSATNLWGTSPEEKYNWSSVWTNATTNFPSPGGVHPYEGTQIPSIGIVYFEFNDDRPSTYGWRYWAPMSDSDRQIDPDDRLGDISGDTLHEGEYIQSARDPIGPTNAAWKAAFYGETAPTLVPAHKTQIVEFTFTAADAGYGRIWICLGKQVPPYTSPPVVINSTFRLMVEHEGGGLGQNPRIRGPTTMRWYVENIFPTDGTKIRLFPMCRCDDQSTTRGKLIVRLGPKVLTGQNPGDPTDFPDGDDNAQNTQLFIQGYPLPQTHLEFPNPPGDLS